MNSSGSKPLLRTVRVDELWARINDRVMSNIQIRVYTHDDIEAILSLDEEWEREGIAQVWVPLSLDEQLALLDQFPAYHLIAEADGVAAGYINGSIRAGGKESVIPEGERYLEIENIYVKMDYRHQHVGGQLVDAISQAAERNGIRRFLVSTTSREMDKMLRFYGDHGFKTWYVQLVRQ